MQENLICIDASFVCFSLINPENTHRDIYYCCQCLVFFSVLFSGTTQWPASVSRRLCSLHQICFFFSILNLLERIHMITSSAMHSHRMHHSRSPFTDGKRSKASHVNEFAYPIDPRQFYTIISVKNISPKLSDIDVEKLCYKKFSKYGSISVKLSSRGYDRVAFIHFTNHEDARKARHARSDLIWDNLPVILEPYA